MANSLGESVSGVLPVPFALSQSETVRIVNIRAKVLAEEAL
jgi:hypothetical protein